jgi:hypothetical protein
VRRLAWAILAFCVAVALGIVALAVVERGGRVDALAVTVPIIAYPLVGALVIARRGNRVGWAFCLTGLAFALTWGGDQVAHFTLTEHHWSIGVGRAFEALSSAGQLPAFCGLGVVLLLFPSGSVHSRRARFTLRALVASAAVGALGYALMEGPFEDPYQHFTNPIGIPGGRDPFNVLASLAWFVCLACVLGAAVSLVVRLRRARGLEQLQLKWVVYAGAVLAAVFLAGFPTFFFDDTSEAVKALRSGAFTIASAGIAVAAGIAILRYRLYDIDVVINRTLVYGSLTATLAVVYVGSVLLLQLALDPVTSGSSLAVAISTLGVAALFRPARTGIQSTVDRRFYRRRYDAARTLEGFSARLREQVDLDELGGELRGVVAETMQPAHVSLWLRGEARS